jgi:hypothetical protein
LKYHLVLQIPIALVLQITIGTSNTMSNDQRPTKKKKKKQQQQSGYKSRACTTCSRLKRSQKLTALIRSTTVVPPTALKNPDSTPYPFGDLRSSSYWLTTPLKIPSIQNLVKNKKCYISTLPPQRMLGNSHLNISHPSYESWVS